MPAPRWFFRFAYDRESAGWERQGDEPDQRQRIDERVGALAAVVGGSGPLADLGCGPGTHALALARRGYEVVGLDGSPRMVEAAQRRSADDGVAATFAVHDVGRPLPFADASLDGALALHVVQHLPQPASFVAEVRRSLRPGGHLLISAPVRAHAPTSSQGAYWRVRGALYQRMPGLVRFYDATSLVELVRGAGFRVLDRREEPTRITLLAHT